MRAVLRGVRRRHLFSNTRRLSRGSYAIVAMQLACYSGDRDRLSGMGLRVGIYVLYAGYVAMLFGALVGLE